ncbi:hypothetical protein OHB01_25945 [Microbispora hainanensis]|nr:MULTISPECIES: hypothetical protein [Microbispora]NJP30274.1 hypothetical protein [Microbispora sp. CL1-1]
MAVDSDEQRAGGVADLGHKGQKVAQGPEEAGSGDAPYGFGDGLGG